MRMLIKPLTLALLLFALHSHADIPPGWKCEYTLGSPEIFTIKNSCQSGCPITPEKKKVSSGNVRCTHPDFEDVYTMAACRVRTSGILSAQECGNATKERGEKDPVSLKTVDEAQLKRPEKTSAPTMADGVPKEVVGTDCEYTVGSPVLMSINNSCDSGCNLKPPEKTMVSGSIVCKKPGLAPFYTVTMCFLRKGKIPSANECRILQYTAKGDEQIESETLKDSKLRILAQGGSNDPLLDDTTAHQR